MISFSFAIFLLLLNILLTDISFPAFSSENSKFVTVIYPVRSRELWGDNFLRNIDEVKKLNANSNIVATWLLQYDVLDDQDLISEIKSIPNSDEVGAFLEISEKLATDAKVPYKLGEGDYYRTDKVLLTGYSPSDRKKLIDSYFKKFYKEFGYYPKSAGSWYIDSVSQKYLYKKGVRAAVTVADQFDTDGASVWGKYYSMPFYPSALNSLEPASNDTVKIPVVNVQWAQRHLTYGYGRNVYDSRQSLQANDYISNGYDFNYFKELVDMYLNQNVDTMQLTIGLEVGQESTRFLDELSKQLAYISELNNKDGLKVVSLKTFAEYYKKNHKSLSPSYLLKDDQSIWYMSPKARIAIFFDNGKLKIKDLRFYNSEPAKDNLQSDETTYLNRRTKATIDDVDLNNGFYLQGVSIKKIFTSDDKLEIYTESETVTLTDNGLYINGARYIKNNKYSTTIAKYELLNEILSIKQTFLYPLDCFAYSRLNNQKIIGLRYNEHLVGFKGKKPGIYKFPFQVIARFKSLRSII